MVPNTTILQFFSPQVAIRGRTSTAANGSIRCRTSTAAKGVAFAVSPTAAQIGGFLSKKPYVPPSWASNLSLAPSHNFTLGQVSFAISNSGPILGLISMQI